MLITASTASTPRNDNASNPMDDDPIRLGQTKEIGALRIHRFSNSTRVTDTANAGKRGKKCREMTVGNRDGLWNDADSAASSEINLMAVRGASLDQMAEALRPWYAVEISELRGIDVTPVGGEIEIINPWMIARFAPGEFSARDMSDPNESTIMDRDGRKRSAAKAYAWAKANVQALASMRWAELRSALIAQGVEFHLFCGMD